MPRRTKTTGGGVTVGFYGTGELEVGDAAETLLVEWIDARVGQDDPVRWAFVLTSEEFTDSLVELAKLSSRGNIPYDVMTVPGDKPSKEQLAIMNKASRRHNVEDPLAHMVMYLQDAVDGVAFFLWDEKEEANLNRALVRFLNANVPCYDLTDGLTPMDFPADTEAEEEGEEESEEADEEEADGEDEEPEEDEEEALFSRHDLESKEMSDLKVIAKDLGITTRYRTPAPLIQAILDIQGEPTESAEEPEPEEPAEDTEPAEAPVAPEEALAGVMAGYTPNGVTADQEAFWTGLVTTAVDRLLDGMAKLVNGRGPEAAEPEAEAEAPPRRRLARRA